MKYLLCLFVLFAALTATGCIDTTQIVVDNTVKEIKKNLPRQLDDNTKWTDVKGGEHRIIYIYEITGFTDEEIVNIRKGVRAELLKSMTTPKNQSQMKDLWSRDISVEYRYFDEDGRQVTSEVFTAEDVGYQP